MSILIKGIKFDGNCWNCPCLDGEYGDCNALGKKVNHTGDPLPDCPIIELPDHGRLVDVDEMERKFLEVTGTRISFNGVPTVIPAERSEE